MYTKGIAVSQDMDEAFKWYSRAADQGDTDAEFNLGLFYEKGIISPADSATAITLYRRAASKGKKLAIEAISRLEGSGAGQ
jgi:uncharacterized protein